MNSSHWCLRPSNAMNNQRCLAIHGDLDLCLSSSYNWYIYYLPRNYSYHWKLSAETCISMKMTGFGFSERSLVLFLLCLMAMTWSLQVPCRSEQIWSSYLYWILLLVYYFKGSLWNWRQLYLSWNNRVMLGLYNANGPLLGQELLGNGFLAASLLRWCLKLGCWRSFSGKWYPRWHRFDSVG